MIRRAPWILALIASLATATVAIVWLNDPDSYPYGRDDIVKTGLNYLIERDLGTAVALTAAVAGVVLAVTGMVRPGVRILTPGCVLMALCFASILGDGSMIAALGYLIAMTLPLTVATLLILVGRHWRRVGIAMAIGAVVLGVGALITGGVADLGDAFATYYGGLLADPEGYYPRMAWTLGWLAAAAGWAWAALSAQRAARSDRPEPAPASLAAAAHRWGRAATIAAALCPVPYGLCRLMWITPWPLGGNGADEFVVSRSLDTATRLQGFLFAPAAAIGVALTLGLISGWGEVFPRWLPAVGGRAVPVMLAVVPGGLVAAVMTLAGPASLVDLIVEGDPLEFAYHFFFMPFAVWGPLLAFAVYAYWLRRTTASPATSVPPMRVGR